MNSWINERYCQILGAVTSVSLCLDIWLCGQSPTYDVHHRNGFMQNTIIIIVEVSTIFPFIFIDMADLSRRRINLWQTCWVGHTKMCANKDIFLILRFCICNEIYLKWKRPALRHSCWAYMWQLVTDQSCTHKTIVDKLACIPTRIMNRRGFLKRIDFDLRTRANKNRLLREVACQPEKWNNRDAV